MVPFPGEDGILKWEGSFSPDGGTFFTAAKWLLECLDSELDNIAYMCNVQKNNLPHSRNQEVMTSHIVEVRDMQARHPIPEEAARSEPGALYILF